MQKITDLLRRVPSNLVMFLVIVSVLLASRTLFTSGYFLMHDDLQMMRQLEMEKCILDGQIPCRWVMDMGYGFGYPLFNFYPPLPYILGELFRLFGIPFTSTAKLTFALSFLVSGIGMYKLASKFYGRLGGLLASVFYVWAPYHAVDVYVRGAMNEAWAIAVFPFIFLYAYEIIHNEKNLTRNTIFMGISFAALLLSHNLMAMIFTPVLFLWVLINLFIRKTLKSIPSFILSALIAVGLSAFFTFPVFFERNLVKIDQLIEEYYQYVAHFASFRQLFFSRYWGDGPSVFGTQDDQMPFPVGHLHWILSLASFLIVSVVALRNIKNVKKLLNDKKVIFTVFFVGVGFLGAFMSHAKSYYLWEIVPSLKFVQFPWRFLTISFFGMSLGAAALPALLAGENKTRSVTKILMTPVRSLLAIFFSAFLIIFNWNYFKPVRSGPLTDEQKFSGEAWRMQQMAGIRDYLPVSAKTDPKSQRNRDYEIKEGEAVISNYEQGSDWAKFNADVEKGEATIKINIIYFPNWTVKVDGVKTEVFIPEEEEWGRMWIKVPQGKHLIFAELLNTPVRTVGNIVSLITAFILLGYFIFKKYLVTLKKK